MQVTQKYAQDFTQDERMTYIGGSDIAAIMGKSRWCTPLKMWAYKTGRLPTPDLSKNERVKFGKKLEWVVAEEYATRHNVKVQSRKDAYTHPKFNFLKAHVDRLIINSDKILEAKTCGAEKGKEWLNSNVPTEYTLQGNWNAGMAKRNIFSIAVLIGGNHYEEVTLNFDKQLFDMQVEIAVNFWKEYVVKNVMPPVSADDESILLEIYPKHTEDMIENQEIEDRIAYLKELENYQKEQDEEIKKIKNELTAIIGDKQGILTNKYKVTWKEITKEYPDSEKLKTDGIFENYSKITTYRQMRIDKRKDVA